jgi:hypothetical protein
MSSYRVLHSIVRFGHAGAIMLTVLVALAVAGAGFTSLGWMAVLLGIACGAVVYFLARSYVELVTLIVDMLLPK